MAEIIVNPSKKKVVGISMVWCRHCVKNRGVKDTQNALLFETKAFWI
jgi:hypothetical protein